jgi:hypothetical protein
MWRAYYAEERRWPSAPFWRRRRAWSSEAGGKGTGAENVGASASPHHLALPGWLKSPRAGVE